MARYYLNLLSIKQVLKKLDFIYSLQDKQPRPQINLTNPHIYQNCLKPRRFYNYYSQLPKLLCQLSIQAYKRLAPLLPETSFLTQNLRGKLTFNEIQPPSGTFFPQSNSSGKLAFKKRSATETHHPTNPINFLFSPEIGKKLTFSTPSPPPNPLPKSPTSKRAYGFPVSPKLAFRSFLIQINQPFPAEVPMNFTFLLLKPPVPSMCRNLKPRQSIPKTAFYYA